MMGSSVPINIDDVVLNFSSANVFLMNFILAIVTFSIAIDLKPMDFGRLVQSPKAVLTAVFSQFVFLPVMTFVLIVVLRPHPSLALGLVLVAACPGGIISNYLTYRAGGNAALSVSSTAISSLGAILLTPLNIALWGSLYAPTRSILQKTSVDPVTVFIVIVFVLALPMVIGIFLNVRFPRLTQLARTPLKYVTSAIVVSFIVFALSANWDLLLEYAGILAGLAILHNALALFGGYSIATLAGLSPFDRRAVTLETGIQNAGLGLVLTFTFFGDYGGMALIVALWGVWLMFSGVGVAWAMSRTDVRDELSI